VWNLYGTPGCREDRKGFTTAWLPEDKKGEHRTSATSDAVSTILPQQFCKEVVLWSTLSHPNVVKLTGVHGDMRKGQFITVSEWMSHGNIMEFIENNHTNRLELVCGITFLTTPIAEVRR